ncbi:hypothetical protein F9L16_23475 [Agarivorans sp. B2Z047]|uniref:hypothetical protein n=1 Tax=Agarivorans sp. B2Z047 TaxID=2652721 RepID=UPI00128C5FF0|nr:hypothetical protein [Agarivorans sp. B2Z047]MPW31918.1 hypothetical protein [Agarivorans sp. B2Z047]UQN44858.1 hypothetical protein LQZ07_10455 [Agarivorans sp. B2Z047]
MTTVDALICSTLGAHVCDLGIGFFIANYKNNKTEHKRREKVELLNATVLLRYSELVGRENRLSQWLFRARKSPQGAGAAPGAWYLRGPLGTKGRKKPPPEE